MEVPSLGRIYGEGRHVYVGPDARESRFRAEAGGAPCYPGKACHAQ